MRGGLNIRALAPRHMAVGRAGEGCGRGSPPPGSGGPGVSPRKTFQNCNVRRRIFTHSKGNRPSLNSWMFQFWKKRMNYCYEICDLLEIRGFFRTPNSPRPPIYGLSTTLLMRCKTKIWK